MDWNSQQLIRFQFLWGNICLLGDAQWLIQDWFSSDGANYKGAQCGVQYQVCPQASARRVLQKGTKSP